MLKKRQTRAERNIEWIQDHCRIPAGPNKGDRVRLTDAQRDLIRLIYDVPNRVPVEDRELSAYLALLHTCGAEATIAAIDPNMPNIATDSFTVWSAASAETLRAVLERRGELIICPALGTRYPRVA